MFVSEPGTDLSTTRPFSQGLRSLGIVLLYSYYNIKYILSH